MKRGLEPFYTGKKSAVVLDRVWKSNIPSICEQSIQDLNVYGENPTVDEITQIESIDELFRYEIIKIANSKLKIKRCENCGKFFIPRGKRSDTKYCNRIAPGKKDICSVVGANAKYIHSRKHPAMELYNRANKHYDYLWRSVGSIAEKEYEKWRYYTTNLREKCRDDEITLEEFENWINLDFHKAIAEIEGREYYIK
jgi:hypothetical protein